MNDQNQVGFVPSNYVRKESFVEKTFKGFSKPRSKSTEQSSPTVIFLYFYSTKFWFPKIYIILITPLGYIYNVEKKFVFCYYI